MNRVRTKIANVFLRVLGLTEFVMNWFFVFLRSKIRATQESTVSPNDPNGWEKLYLSQVAPVTVMKSEIALKLAELTKDGELLLETGCGGGGLSAELALSGRRAAVCDFSQPILDRVKHLFEVSGLKEPQTYLVDLTKPLPFKDNQFDVVWNSGVLEHWTDDELRPIVAELVRCAKRCVISLVPNERSLLYRYGRETAEAHGICPWGREMPRSSLRQIFEGVGLTGITETTISLSEAPGLISLIDPVFSKKLKKWWESVPASDPVKENQGYLLVTVGYKKK